MLHISGRLMDRNQATALFEEVEYLLKLDNKFIAVNLENTEYMNSTGLNVLINVLTKTRNAGGESIIANVPDKVNQLLLVTRLNTVFTVAKTLDEAVAKLQEQHNASV